MTAACALHPEHAAIEYCEVCQKPLCGLCLWYTDGGRRLCETHAQAAEEQGEQVLPPHTYHEALQNSLSPAPAQNALPAQGVHTIYHGNQTDVSALVAAIAGLTTLASCAGGAYCLPVLFLLLGGYTYLNADSAVDPRRTRRLALVGIGVFGFMLFIFAAFIGMYILIIFFALAAGGGTP